MKTVYVIQEQGTGYNDEDYFFKGHELQPKAFLTKESAEGEARALNLRWLNELDNWYAGTVFKRLDLAQKQFPQIDFEDYDYHEKIAALSPTEKEKILPLMHKKYFVTELKVL